MRSNIQFASVLRVKFITAMLMLFMFNLPTHATIETHTFDTDVERLRYQSFIEEMRCPKCQNQNLAGSDSPISADLRREIYGMIKAGQSDQEIVSYMVTRYGDFILYRPRVTPITYLLWAAPVALLIIGVVVMLVMLRQRRRLASAQLITTLTTDEKIRLNALLADTKKNDPTNTKEPH